MGKALMIRPELCTGCASCELACAWVQTGSFEIHASVIKVHSYGEQLRFAPYTCFQCDEAWCMTACPTDAIAIDPLTGARVVIEPACVGCALCTLACPYGTVFLHPGKGSAAKCDLCRGDPACVWACPTDAIQLVEAQAAQDWVGAWAEGHNTDLLRELSDSKGG